MNLTHYHSTYNILPNNNIFLLIYDPKEIGPEKELNPALFEVISRQNFMDFVL